MIKVNKVEDFYEFEMKRLFIGLKVGQSTVLQFYKYIYQSFVDNKWKKVRKNYFIFCPIQYKIYTAKLKFTLLLPAPYRT
jgi:hypothetical protein